MKNQVFFKNFRKNPLFTAKKKQGKGRGERE